LSIFIFLVSTSGNCLPPYGRPVDFQSLSSALTIIAIHYSTVCLGGWALLKWLGVDSLHCTELVTLIGYSLLLFYPVLLLSMLSIWALTWVAALIGIAGSAYFVYHNLHPVLRTSAIGVDKAKIYSSALVLVHVFFLISLKVSLL
jgi:hypothetical protein